MVYKTFEGISRYIPEGATHYQDESHDEFFAFFKSVGGVNYYYCPDFIGEWRVLPNQNEMGENCVKPIPQTETPKEKERERTEEAAEMIQCLLDNYSECEESAINYVLEFLYECDYRKAK